MSKAIRRIIMVALVAALAFLIFRPTSEAEQKPQATGSGLRTRVETYIAKRLENDWADVYEMAAPAHRRKVDLRAFLNAYGHGAMRVVSLTPKSTRFSKDGRAALVTMDLDGELVLDRLPPTFRKGLKTKGPEDLRQTSEFEITWVWREGDWFFELDPALVKGRDQSGRVPQTYGAQIGPSPDGGR
ncbi:MAG: hypothetical protein GY711_16085 [bacterium]|nr:hypothetical protein [bacterium]